MRQVDDRKQQGGTGQIRQEAVRIEIGGKIPLALGHVDAVIEQLHLALFGASQQGFLAERGVPGGRQLAQEIGAAVVDHEEVRALRVVGAAGGASGHVDVGLGHNRLAITRVVERAVGHGQAGAAGQCDQYRFLQRRQRLALIGAFVAHPSRRDIATAADAVRAPMPNRFDQWPVEKGLQAGMRRIGCVAHAYHVVRTGTGRHGANALASRGVMLASSGQWRRMTLVMPFCSIQSMPKGE